MATIENLRTKAFGALGRELSKKTPITTFVNGYIVGAQEQDQISRQEEIERCVKAAQDWFCESRCNLYRNHKCELAEDLSEAGLDCFFHSQLRKALEGGNNG